MKWRKRLMVVLAGFALGSSGGSAEEAAAKQPVKKVTEDAEEVVAKKTGEKTEEKAAPGSRKKEPLYDVARLSPRVTIELRYATDVGSSRVDLQACKLEYSIVSPK